MQAGTTVKLAVGAAAVALLLLSLVALASDRKGVSLLGQTAQVTEEDIISSMFGGKSVTSKASHSRSQQLRIRAKKVAKAHNTVSMSALMDQYKAADSNVARLKQLLKAAKKNQKWEHYVESPAFWGGGVVSKPPPKP
mmetsp:Transcript_36827/g.57579  ORF Transcript_36827/g.57579 Transcript_36827/m.57579 type:complete len:138 (+) Transcript_36827:535-948(+)|eukprot:CAMPEP_0184310284 /NCGR_PEP_ID=MMETSP1049-20130417/26768_1 /TAXON_ID=77928 /ORGANISM="Proteomonas sulcata, Strain CCMP704" /LENGTH=137 /DNA_ID=CAMNT_0026624155 /DNA_START=499 /DNA_END=912 /DNA_ORIENTATION=-